MSDYQNDPFHDREKKKYDSPLPSREWILQVLNEFGRPMSRRRLFEKLEVVEKDQEALGFRLKAMLRDGQIIEDRRGRLCLFKRINLKRGTVQAHPDGYGFFIPEGGGEDMVLSAHEMRAVMHGDVVLAYQTGLDRRKRPEGKIHEVIEHVNKTVVGRYLSEHGVGMVFPDSKYLTQDISIPPEFSLNAKNGQMVLVELVTFPGRRSLGIGRVTQILGEHMAPGMEIDVAILNHGIPSIFPESVLSEASLIPASVSEKDCKGRMDLRDLSFVTIDGEDAKDFDDAVYCEKKPKGGFKLCVAIADVSHYVKPDTALDNEALLRGNSVYFPGRVIPMLPENLSNGICSLNPNVDRLAMVAELSINAKGKITRSRFFRAVFRSKARLTYGQVAKWLQGEEVPLPYAELWPMLTHLNELYHALLEARKERGAMDFDTQETMIEFDVSRKIERIVPVIRNDAHRLIEECMLAANVSVATFLNKAKIPIPYRVHAPPEASKIESLRDFLSAFALHLTGGKKPGPKDFQKTLSHVEGRPEMHLVQTVMLRSLKQAQYLEENSGHFGLAYPIYTHFTSPIRRYPDLLVHRALGHILDFQDVLTFTYTDEEIGRLSRHCSVTERRADEATRSVVQWLKCEYMQNKLGQVFQGRISAVTSFGIFVELNDIYVEGLVHVTALRNDYYAFDSIHHRLVGGRGGQIYALGDPITVMVARVDLDERKIDFELSDDEVS